MTYGFAWSQATSENGTGSCGTTVVWVPSVSFSGRLVPGALSWLNLPRQIQTRLTQRGHARVEALLYFGQHHWVLLNLAGLERVVHVHTQAVFILPWSCST